MFSRTLLQDYVEKKRVSIDRDTYFEITDLETDQLVYRLMSPNLKFSENSEGTQFLGMGWSLPEEWGVWSNSNTTELFLPCLIQNTQIKAVWVTANSFGEQSILVNLQGSAAKKYQMNGGGNQIFRFTLDPKLCKYSKFNLKISIPNAKSPSSLGLSEDSRNLGIGLVGMIFSTQDIPQKSEN
jgi:hypothetical protein